MRNLSGIEGLFYSFAVIVFGEVPVPDALCQYRQTSCQERDGAAKQSAFRVKIE